MWKWTSLLLTVAACGFPRPADVNACTAGEFSECRGSAALTCNTAGDGYDAIQCERGCDPAAGGCRLCQASQTVCVNGKVQSCDATGTVTSSEACPLGCFEDQPRCREIDPSNGLAKYFNMVANPPDLDLSSGGTIQTTNGVIQDSRKTDIIIPIFLYTLPSQVPIRIIVAGNVRLGDVDILPSGGMSLPLAILAKGEVSVEGRLNVLAGGVTSDNCKGGAGIGGNASGGGGHATAGGAGGGINSVGGAGGGFSGTDTLTPLRGGCASGATDVSTPPATSLGSPGGRAIQLSSRVKIHVLDHAIIDANGASGSNDQGGPPAVPWGGGAGGGILLEAPEIALGDGARLLTNGGPGAPGDAQTGDKFPESLTLAPASGPPCSSPSASCGSGGAGASVGSLAGNGMSVSVGSPGSGGGGLGRIRINTRTGGYNKASTTIEAGTLTAGSVSTH